MLPMAHLGFFLSLLFLAASLEPSCAQAAVEGKVTLPPAAALKPAAARYVAPAGTSPGPRDPPAAVVYLEGQFGKTEASKTVEMAQKNLQFAPGLLPIQVNTTVIFPNQDDTYHNVFSYSKNKRFDLGRYRKDEKPGSMKFEEPGAIKLFCEVHDHMRGLILVLDTPYFVKTAPDGAFRLENLPEGKFTLKAWLSEHKILERPVELKNGVTTKVDFGEAP